MDPLEWGWKINDGRMTPVHSDLDAAPECSNKRIVPTRGVAVAVLVWSALSHVESAGVYVQTEMRRRTILIYISDI